jgi:hypothetical protein
LRFGEYGRKLRVEVLFLVKTSKLTNAKSNVIAVDFGARARKAA